MKMGKILWVGSSASALELLPEFLMAVNNDRETLLPQRVIVCNFDEPNAATSLIL